MTERRRRRTNRAGFTLIELLVVIGILAVLMSILIPVISKVRTAGFDTATTHRMQAIMSAIDAYYQANNNAYPGPLADDEVYSANNQTGKAVKNTNAGNLPAGVTSTENMILGLLGGAVWTPNANTLGAVSNQPSIDFDSNAVGNGPTNFNVLAQGKKYGPYADAKACGLENMVPTGATPPTDYVAWNDPRHDPHPQFGGSLFHDTKVPEFTDSFPDPLPILYVRAAGGNTATTSMDGAPTQNGQTAGANDKPVWDPSQLQAYPFPATNFDDAVANKPATIQGDQYTGGAVDPAVKLAFPTPHFYFTQGSDHLTPRQRGGYLLIVAGKDRKFMTSDDRINGSPVQ